LVAKEAGVEVMLALEMMAVEGREMDWGAGAMEEVVTGSVMVVVAMVMVAWEGGVPVMAVKAALQMAAVAMGLVAMEVAAMGLAKRVAAETEAEAMADGRAGERDSPCMERVSLH